MRITTYVGGGEKEDEATGKRDQGDLLVKVNQNQVKDFLIRNQLFNLAFLQYLL